MCLYWHKGYMCGCISGRHLDQCREALFTREICTEVGLEATPRKSYFPCYDCIRAEVYQERDAEARAAAAAATAAKNAQEDKRIADELAREMVRKEKLRKDAEARAQRERDEEAKKERDRKADIERQRREGGAWMEASTGRKGKGRKHNGQSGGALGPGPGSPTSMMAMKGAGAASLAKSSGSPAKGLTPNTNVPAGVDPGGRAGRWGPPQKSQENAKPTGWKK
ncbi:hypothetical protein K504DRAFT_381165 [Pleomassaria siparia CBS 279.74]|uniref:Uncharacterized protein n=1 Tax=Pleomassaria siparia CBS 279.74 TaxID=1314801 RepID=A0A6G1K9M1_9PLEO|nr:hypothetical protein K504DRAFT_381165 [Pleomassaria siparia CBS 279.74]